MLRALRLRRPLLAAAGPVFARHLAATPAADAAAALAAAAEHAVIRDDVEVDASGLTFAKAKKAARRVKASAVSGVEAAQVPELAFNNAEDEAAAMFESLPAAVRKAMESMNIKTLFPVQVETLKLARSGSDLVVRSQTGSGKTVAYALPAIERFLTSKRPSGGSVLPRCLILCPTRELAIQITEAVSQLAPMLSTVAVYGGVSSSTARRAFRSGVDIVVGTPGRVMDEIERGFLNVSAVEVAILDEADRMLHQQGFLPHIEDIYSHIPPVGKRQTLLFSATIPQDVRRVMDKFMTKPKSIDLIGDDNTKLPESVKLIATMIQPGKKLSALVAIMNDYVTQPGDDVKRALVFVKRKQDCSEVSAALSEANVVAYSLHGDIDQNQRERVLQDFRDGKAQVLVCTDVASRGIDVPETDLVVHYDLDGDRESFVHRTGRTGRAGREGTIIALCDRANMHHILDIERFVGAKFKFRAVPSGKKMTMIRAERAAELLVQMPPQSVAEFKSLADELRRAHPAVDLLACSLALLAYGSAAPMPSYSTLTGAEGMVTVKADGEPAEVQTALRAALGASAPLAMSPASRKLAYFDVPESSLQKVLESSTASVRFAPVEGEIDHTPALGHSGGARRSFGASSRYGGSSGGGSYGGGYSSSKYGARESPGYRGGYERSSGSREDSWRSGGSGSGYRKYER